jgi:uncharacterized protein
VTTTIPAGDPLALAAIAAVQGDDVAAVERMLADHPELATPRVEDEHAAQGPLSFTLLHKAVDAPGHRPAGPAVIAALLAAGADVDARYAGPHPETPQHWAASNDDVPALDALIDAGADLEADGAVVAGGAPLDDAVAFGQWRTARRLAERGASTALWHAAALGLMDRVTGHLAGDRLAVAHAWGPGSTEPPGDITVAFWIACAAGQREAAELLASHGADIDWVSPWDGLTPLDVAENGGATGLAVWLRAQGARSAADLAG